MSTVDDAVGQEMSIYRTEHPYYGPEGGSYWTPGDQYDKWNPHCGSWREFLDLGMSDSPEDLNILIRWDWLDGEWDGDGRDTLILHYVLPRKSIFLTYTVAVTVEDEPAIREWLTPRWEYMREMWAPFGVSQSRRAQFGRGSE